VRAVEDLLGLGGYGRVWSSVCHDGRVVQDVRKEQINRMAAEKK
jgi:hypothetical protein